MKAAGQHCTQFLHPERGVATSLHVLVLLQQHFSDGPELGSDRIPVLHFGKSFAEGFPFQLNVQGTLSGRKPNFQELPMPFPHFFRVSYHMCSDMSLKWAVTREDRCSTCKLLSVATTGFFLLVTTGMPLPGKQIPCNFFPLAS